MPCFPVSSRAILARLRLWLETVAVPTEAGPRESTVDIGQRAEIARAAWRNVAHSIRPGPGCLVFEGWELFPADMERGTGSRMVMKILVGVVGQGNEPVEVVLLQVAMGKTAVEVERWIAVEAHLEVEEGITSSLLAVMDQEAVAGDLKEVG